MNTHDNSLEALPEDLSRYIMMLSTVPSIDELTNDVYDSVIKRFEPYGVGVIVIEGDDQYEEEVDIGDYDAKDYRSIVINAINECYSTLKAYQVENIYNNLFRNKKRTLDFLNNDNSGYSSNNYEDDVIYNDDYDEYVEEAIKMKIFHDYVAYYKLVIDDIKLDDEGEYYGTMCIKKRNVSY